jgi:hypothetical protein
VQPTILRNFSVLNLALDRTDKYLKLDSKQLMLPTENVTLKNSPRNQDRAYFPLYTTLDKTKFTLEVSFFLQQLYKKKLSFEIALILILLKYIQYQN